MWSISHVVIGSITFCMCTDHTDTGIKVAICLHFCVGHYGCITARPYRYSVWSATYWSLHAYTPSCTIISTFGALSGHTNNNIWKYKSIITICLVLLMHLYLLGLLIWSKVVMFNTSASTSNRKKGRGPAKGLKLAKRAQETTDGKLDIEFSDKSNSAVGPNQRMFVDEVVQQMRTYAPLNVKKWAEVPQEAKDNIVAAVLVSKEIYMYIYAHVCVCVCFL